MRSKSRQALGTLLIASIVLTACSSDSDAGRGARSTGSVGGATAEGFPYVRPTAAANAAIDAYPLDRTGKNCGGGPADWGYPTTTAPRPTTCLPDADRSGTKAFMVFTGRDGDGGALLRNYRTEGSGSVFVLDVYADPKGKLRTTRWTCAVPTGSAGLSFGFGGMGHEIVAPIEGCRRADG